MNANRVVMLFHHRWAVPILAELHRTQGSKFVTLANRLEISRESASYTLQALIRWGWVIRNPGHGHPLRPEYLLTKSGMAIALWCMRVMRIIRALGAERVALKKWSLPVTLALGTGRQRFSEMKAYLPGLTARALASALKELVEAGLVRRCITAGHPPGSHYQLTPKARKLTELLPSSP